MKDQQKIRSWYKVPLSSLDVCVGVSDSLTVCSDGCADMTVEDWGEGAEDILTTLKEQERCHSNLITRMYWLWTLNYEILPHERTQWNLKLWYTCGCLCTHQVCRCRTPVSWLTSSCHLCMWIKTRVTPVDNLSSCEHLDRAMVGRRWYSTRYCGEIHWIGQRLITRDHPLYK